MSRLEFDEGIEVGVTAERGVVAGVEEGVKLRNAESLRLEAGEAGAEPTAPVPLNHEFFPLVSGSEDDGDNNKPGDNNTTGTWAKCSVGIRI